MSVRLITVTPVSLCLEMDDDSACQSQTPHRIWLDGIELAATHNNVITLRDLRPDSDYHIRVDDEILQARTAILSAVLDPRDFGAKADGQQDDTQAIQAAIAACPADGLVRLKGGDFLSGPLFLKSRMNLEICHDARLLGLRDVSQWPVLPGILYDADGRESDWLGSWEGEPLGCHAALINIINAQHVRIFGQGTIDGQAGFDSWWQPDFIAREKASFPRVPAFASWRPRLIFCVDSQNLTFEGLTLTNSPSWTLHPLHCDDITAACLHIKAPANSPNTDGLNPESCTRVRIAGVHFTVGDDCIALKSGKISMAKRALRPTRNVEISNCYMEKGHGGVVVGSEMSSGIYDVIIRDCRFAGTDRGVRIKTRRGRGKDAIVRNIRCHNLQMQDVGTPFVINSFYECDPDGKTDYVSSRHALPVDDGTPCLGYFHLSSVICTGVRAAAIYVLGLPEMPIDGLVIENFSARYSENTTPEAPDMAASIIPVLHMGISISHARHVRLEHISIEGQNGDPIRLEAVS